MKTKASISATVAGLGLLAVTLCSGHPVWAQQDGGGPGAGGPGGGGFGGGPGGGGDFGGGPGGGGDFGGGQGGGGFGGGRGGGMMGGQGGMGGGLSQLPFTMLISSLNLNDDQQGKIAIVLLEARDTMQGAQGGMGGMGGGQRGQNGNGGNGGGGQRGQNGGGRAAEEALQKKIEGLLTEDQVPRLKSLLAALRTLQAAGVPARATTKLNLTSDQTAALAAAAPAAQNGGGQGGQRMSQDAMQKTRDDAKKVITATLSADQLSQIKSYLDRQPGGFGGGPGGGGGFGGQGGGPGGGGGFGGGPGGGGNGGGPGGNGPGDGNGPPPAAGE